MIHKASLNKRLMKSTECTKLSAEDDHNHANVVSNVTLRLLCCL